MFIALTCAVGCANSTNSPSAGVGGQDGNQNVGTAAGTGGGSAQGGVPSAGGTSTGGKSSLATGGATLALGGGGPLAVAVAGPENTAVTPKVHINQVGFDLLAPKRAVVEASGTGSITTFQIIDQTKTKVYLSG